MARRSRRAASRSGAAERGCDALPVPHLRRVHGPPVRRQPAGGAARGGRAGYGRHAADRRRVQLLGDDVRPAAVRSGELGASPDLHPEVRDAVRRPSDRGHGPRAGVARSHAAGRRRSCSRSRPGPCRYGSWTMPRVGRSPSSRHRRRPVMGPRSTPQRWLGHWAWHPRKSSPVPACPVRLLAACRSSWSNWPTERPWPAPP